VGREVGAKRLMVKRKQVRLGLEQVARELRPDVVVTTSNHRHALSRERRAELAQRDPFWRCLRQVQAFHGDVQQRCPSFNPWMSDFDLLLFTPDAANATSFAAMRVLDRAGCALVGHPNRTGFKAAKSRVRARVRRWGWTMLPRFVCANARRTQFVFLMGRSICRSVPRNCNLIVKPHPSLATTSEVERSGRKDLERVKNCYANAALVVAARTGHRASDGRRDVLITDYSSVRKSFWFLTAL
jgi:hypothetical protein